MTVIALLNSKGGSGKSTLATNLAAWLALQGEHVMLGDLDRQQSVGAWLNRRPPELPPISTWTRDDNKVFRAPPGTTRVILDTPGALYDHQLSRALVWVDAVIVPVGPSLFDVATFVPFYESLRQIPRVKSQRCAVMAIGMRWEPGQLDRWRADPSTRNIPLITVLEEHPSYPRACAQGKGIFDLPVDQVPPRLVRQWEPMLAWIDLQARRQQASRQQPTAPPRTQPTASLLPPLARASGNGQATHPTQAAGTAAKQGVTGAQPAAHRAPTGTPPDRSPPHEHPPGVAEGLRTPQAADGDKGSGTWWQRLTRRTPSR